ncbi:DUF305 domain-containing protein [Streptomyces sp. NRRL S-340]|uniref:DUF305 domain-containing protein n=1 Tax=Streptomyces sp. NRRL S-340 TaxID=1463901 RepID=UPI000AF6CAF1|nr:DUF305 domain-containing protein [Streptomyces sp. NRRL S-340]
MNVPIPWRRRGAVLLALGAVLCGPAAPALARTTVPTPVATAGAPTADARTGGDGPAALSLAPLACRLGEELAALRGKDLETAFLAGIIAHHEAAIGMARLETERGTDGALRARANDLITAHQRQVEQFTRWLRQWYGMTPEQASAKLPAGVGRAVRGLEQEGRRLLAGLRATAGGEAFDRAFVNMMIPHHNSGLVEFLEPQARAVHAELRAAAASGATGQESEITDFLAWLSRHAGQSAIPPADTSAATSTSASASAQAVLPRGAADTGDGAGQASTAPLIAAGSAVAAAGAGAGALLLLRRRRGAARG